MLKVLIRSRVIYIPCNIFSIKIAAKIIEVLHYRLRFQNCECCPVSFVVFVSPCNFDTINAIRATCCREHAAILQNLNLKLQYADSRRTKNSYIKFRRNGINA